MNEFITDLKRLVADLKIDEVIKTLNHLFTAASPEHETVLVIIDANRQRLYSQQKQGIISNQEYGLEFNKIMHNILSLIDEIQSNFDRYFPFISGKKIKELENNKDTIFFLGVNPGGFDIDIRKEVEQISDRLTLLKKRASFEFKVKLDVSPIDFQRSLVKLDKEPRFFHFGGNALIEDPEFGSGIVLSGNNPNEIKVVTGEVLASIFSRFNQVECVFLNACNTMPFGIEIAKHIPYVIAMNRYTTDKFAIDFASYFYEAIGAEKSIKYSFEYSIDMLKLQGGYKKEQIDTPKLLERGNNYVFDWYNQTYEEWWDSVKPG